MKKETPFYMIYVQGERSPQMKHAHLDQAEKEAQRLCNLTEKEVFVLSPIKSYKPVPKVPLFIETQFEEKDIPF